MNSDRQVMAGPEQRPMDTGRQKTDERRPAGSTEQGLSDCIVTAGSWKTPPMRKSCNRVDIAPDQPATDINDGQQCARRTGAATAESGRSSEDLGCDEEDRGSGRSEQLLKSRIDCERAAESAQERRRSLRATQVCGKPHEGGACGLSPSGQVSDGERLPRTLDGRKHGAVLPDGHTPARETQLVDRRSSGLWLQIGIERSNSACGVSKHVAV
ncbi:hypothetical protein PC123_g21863 [Phytophthora cactorum]|nr:hypothetical protein PC123_g21863 [Phytophthora cactorum]